MANFIVQFPLKIEMYQEDMLNKRFEIGRKIYNSLINVTQKRYKEMIKTKKYRTLLSSLTGNKKTDKDIWKQITQFLSPCGRWLRVEILIYTLHNLLNKYIL